VLRTVVLVTLLVPLLVDVPVVVAVCVALEGSCIGTQGGIGDPKTGSSFSLQVNFCAETCLATSHALRARARIDPIVPIGDWISGFLSSETRLETSRTSSWSTRKRGYRGCWNWPNHADT